MGKGGYFDRVAAPRRQAMPVLSPTPRQIDAGPGFVEAPAAVVPARPQASPGPFTRPAVPPVSPFSLAVAPAMQPVSSPDAVVSPAAPFAVPQAADQRMAKAPPPDLAPFRAQPEIPQDTGPAALAALAAKIPASRAPAQTDLPRPGDALPAAVSLSAAAPAAAARPPFNAMPDMPAPAQAAAPSRQVAPQPAMPGPLPGKAAAEVATSPSIHIGTIEVRTSPVAAPPPALAPARARSTSASPSPGLARNFGWRYGIGQS